MRSGVELGTQVEPVPLDSLCGQRIEQAAEKLLGYRVSLALAVAPWWAKVQLPPSSQR